MCGAALQQGSKGAGSLQCRGCTELHDVPCHAWDHQQQASWTAGPMGHLQGTALPRQLPQLAYQQLC